MRGAAAHYSRTAGFHSSQPAQPPAPPAAPSPHRRRPPGRACRPGSTPPLQAAAGKPASHCQASRQSGGHSWCSPCKRPAAPLCVFSLLDRWFNTTWTSPVAGSSNSGTSTAANLPDTCGAGNKQCGMSSTAAAAAAAAAARQIAAPTGCALAAWLHEACRLLTTRSSRHCSASSAALARRVCIDTRSAPDVAPPPLVPPLAAGGAGAPGPCAAALSAVLLLAAAC